MKIILKTFLLIAGATVLTSFTNIFSDELPKTVLLIPHQPKMYLSDADEDIAAHSKINIRQLRVLMRNNLAEKLALRLSENFCVLPLAETGMAKEKEDLNHFYASESFYLSSLDTSRKNSESASTNTDNPYFGIFKEKSSPDYASSYMSVSLSKPVLFKELSADYKADYFLVLTQLEIKTHYNECIDIANRIFRREFIVHFSVFNAEGTQISGSAISVDAGPDVNSINKVSGTLFPALAEKISAHLTAVAP